MDCTRWLDWLYINSFNIQYILRNMHTVSLCFALLWLCNPSEWIHMKYLSIFIRVAFLALGQSLDCHSASEVSLMDMGKSMYNHNKAQQNKNRVHISWGILYWGRGQTISNVFPRISLKIQKIRLRFHWFVFNGPIDNIWALVQIMDWVCIGGPPSSEPMMVGLLMHVLIDN